MPDDVSPSNLPDDLVTALGRLRAEHPGSWLEILADAVVAEGGTDAADLLGMVTDRAASGHLRADECDPELALKTSRPTSRNSSVWMAAVWTPLVSILRPSTCWQTCRP